MLSAPVELIPVDPDAGQVFAIAAVSDNGRFAVLWTAVSGEIHVDLATGATTSLQLHNSKPTDDGRYKLIAAGTSHGDVRQNFVYDTVDRRLMTPATGSPLQCSASPAPGSSTMAVRSATSRTTPLERRGRRSR